MSRGKHYSNYVNSVYEPKYEQSEDTYDNKNKEDYYEGADEDYEDNEEFSKKPIIISLIVIVVVILAVVTIFYLKNKENNSEITNATPANSVETMISTYEGYKVLGKLVINDDSIEQYILDSTEDSALEKGVIKLYGDSLNGYGNFCIAGHNKEGIFEKLSELKEGDYFKIINPSMKETNYKITTIYTCEPDDLNCLLQDNSAVKVTLITCDNMSTKRLVVQAEKTNDKDDSTNQISNTTEKNN